MGTPKQLLRYQECSFLHHTVEVAIGSVCRPIVVKVGSHAQLIRQPGINQPPYSSGRKFAVTEGWVLRFELVTDKKNLFFQR